MRLRLNCVVLGGMVVLGVVVICINYYEMRELRKAVETNARSAAINKGVGVKSTGCYVWIHPENVCKIEHVIICDVFSTETSPASRDHSVSTSWLRTEPSWLAGNVVPRLSIWHS